MLKGVIIIISLIAMLFGAVLYQKTEDPEYRLVKSIDEYSVSASKKNAENLIDAMNEYKHVNKSASSDIVEKARKLLGELHQDIRNENLVKRIGVLNPYSEKKPHFNNSLNGVRFSPDGSSVITLSNSIETAVWDLKSQTKLFSLEAGLPGSGFHRNAGDARFSLDGSMIVTVAGPVLRSWNGKTGELITDFERRGEGVETSIHISPDGNTIFTFSHLVASVWGVHTGKLLYSIKHPDLIFAQLSPDGKLVGTMSRNIGLTLFDAKTGKELFKLNNSEDDNSFGSFVFSSTGNHVLTSPNAGSIRLWDLESRKEIFSTPEPNTEHASVLLSPDTNIIAACLDDNTLNLWDVKDQRIIGKLVTNGYCNPKSFSPDSTKIVMGHWKKSAQLWSIKSQSVLATFEGHASVTNEITFSPDGSLIVTSSDDGTAQLWEYK